MEGGKVRARGDSIAFGFLVAFVAVMYSAPSEWIPALAPLRLALTTSAIACGVLFLTRASSKTPVSIDGAHGWALIAFGFFTLASSTWSLYPEGSLEIAIDCAKYVLIYLTLLNVCRTPERLRIICATIVLASIVTSIGVIDWHLTGENLVEGYRARWVGIYADPNRMAMSLGLVIPIAVAFVLRRHTGTLMRLLSFVAAALALTAIVFSHSRGGIIGLAVGMTLWAIAERKANRVGVLALAAVALVIFAPSSFWSRTESVGDFRHDASALGRVHAWVVAARVSADYPLAGVGAGSFRLAWPLYAPEESRRVYEAHNVFLQVIAELGWIGLFLFLLFIGGAIEAGASAWRDNDDTKQQDVGWLARALVAGNAGYLICSLSAGFLRSSPHFYVIFGLAAAAGAIVRARQQRATAAAPAEVVAAPTVAPSL